MAAPVRGETRLILRTPTRPDREASSSNPAPRRPPRARFLHVLPDGGLRAGDIPFPEHRGQSTQPAHQPHRAAPAAQPPPGPRTTIEVGGRTENEAMSPDQVACCVLR